MISLKFIPLSFITSKDEIIRQIKNTVVFSHLYESCKETTFSNYIETTQYGFTASALESGSHRMLRITDIHHSKVNWESVPFCDCPDDEKYLLNDNDILVARTGGTTGKSFFVKDPPFKAVFASYLIRIRLKKDVNIEFINAFLNSYCFWSQIVEMKAGSAQPNVNAEKLKTLLMPDCALETQEKTVRLINEQDSSDAIQERINQVETLFWNNDKISTELDHQLALVKELRQAYLREAMRGKLVPQDPTDEPAEILLEKIKAEKEKLVAEKRIKRDKPFPPIDPEEAPFEIPSNWVWCVMGEIAYVASGSTPKQDAFVENGVPYLKMYNLRNQKVDFDYKSQFIKESVHYGQLKRCIAVPGDVLMNIVGPPLGKLAIVPESLPECNFNQAIVLIRSFEILVNRWIYFYLNEMSEINSIATKGIAGQDNISVTQSRNMKLPLPPLAEQERIVAKLEKLMKFCDELEANIKQGITNADRLLQTALREALEPGDNQMNGKENTIAEGRV